MDDEVKWKDVWDEVGKSGGKNRRSDGTEDPLIVSTKTSCAELEEVSCDFTIMTVVVLVR